MVRRGEARHLHAGPEGAARRYNCAMQEQRFAAVAAAISRAIGSPVESRPERAVHGGSIHACFRWRSATGALFVKLAPLEQASLLAAEAAGLTVLAGARAVRVPAVRAQGAVEEGAYLALEWIELNPGGDGAEPLGRRLAAQHRVLAERYGWELDGAIGRTPQHNAWSQDWVAFWGERRLGFQLRLAAGRGHGGRLQARGAQLIAQLPALLEGHRPAASLLHGDLWGGNWGTDAHGDPVIFDPAVYYGDRETDLAMTRLFGGFPRKFYSAYEAEWPLPAQAAARVPLYNLYHVLNHANLFGGDYRAQAEHMIDALLAELGH